MLIIITYLMKIFNTTAYLMGAGASYNSLPLVKDIVHQSKEDKRFRSLLSVINYLRFLSKQITKEEYILSEVGSVIQDLEYLKAHLDEFPNRTIDMMMRKMYFADKDNFNRLKKGINLYFNLLEFANSLDLRYDIFLMNMLSNQGELPKNIMILNWNYDRQFQIALNELKQLKVNPIFHFMTADTYRRLPGIKEIKLNGVFSPSFSDSLINVERIKESERPKHFWNTLLLTNSRFNNLINKNSQFDSIKFAWERDDNALIYNQSDSDQIKKSFPLRLPNELQEDLDSVSRLVVIGYSFPFFNRANDIEIIKSITQGNNKNLEIIIQDKHPETIRQTITAICNNINAAHTISYEDPETFHIPENIEYV